MTFHLHLVLLWNVSSTSQEFEYKYSESGTLALSFHKQVLFFHLRRSNFQSYYNSYVKYKVFAITQALLKCYIEDFLNYSCAANLNCSSHSLNSWIVCPLFVNTVSHLILERINEDLRARLRDEEIDILYSKKVLGLSSPQALANTVWFKNMLHFGLRGCNDHELRWWDVVLRATWGFSKVQGVGLPCYSH